MGVINVLDKHVAELIAAGEVVERPASVIKELVENSIDAGAKNITVEIKNGGTTFMRVADDGCGIYRDDIKVAFLRHATSKVKVESDLDSISTLGFRGEALASICAVSRLQLITRNVNEEIGTSYEIDGGEEQSFDDAGCPVGTTFVIRDLFYNIPARAKFLKKDALVGLALLWSLQMPVIKRIWTGSMTLLSGGYCFLLMALFYYWIDYKGHTRGLNWLKVYGMNSITAYLLGEVVSFRCVAASVSYGLEQYLGGYYSVWLTFANYLIVFLLLRAMYKRGLFLKV